MNPAACQRIGVAKQGDANFGHAQSLERRPGQRRQMQHTNDRPGDISPSRMQGCDGHGFKDTAARAGIKKFAFLERVLFPAVTEFVKIALGNFCSRVGQWEAVMGLTIGQGSPPTTIDQESDWPLDARMALFVLEAEGRWVEAGVARELDRQRCRVRARVMRVNLGKPHASEIFIRDLSVTHIGFISSVPLEISAEYEVDFTQTTPARVTCITRRCRQFTRGWYEGVLTLQQSQAAESEWRVAV